MLSALTREQLDKYAFIVHTDALTDCDWCMRDYFVDMNISTRCLDILRQFTKSVYVQTKYWLIEQHDNWWDEKHIDTIINDVVSTTHAMLNYVALSCMFSSLIVVDWLTKRCNFICYASLLYYDKNQRFGLMLNKQT